MVRTDYGHGVTSIRNELLSYSIGPDQIQVGADRRRRADEESQLAYDTGEAGQREVDSR